MKEYTQDRCYNQNVRRITRNNSVNINIQSRKPPINPHHHIFELHQSYLYNHTSSITPALYIPSWHVSYHRWPRLQVHWYVGWTIPNHRISQGLDIYHNKQRLDTSGSSSYGQGLKCSAKQGEKKESDSVVIVTEENIWGTKMVSNCNICHSDLLLRSFEK